MRKAAVFFILLLVSAFLTGCVKKTSQPTVEQVNTVNDKPDTSETDITGNIEEVDALDQDLDVSDVDSEIADINLDSW